MVKNDLQLRKRLMTPIVTRRKELGLKANYVAYRLGISPANYSRIESGITACSYTTYIRLCYIIAIEPPSLINT